jgi:NAD(P)-dependent dehydrogenase (short-subunit alcohol dehydrogenase family)
MQRGNDLRQQRVVVVGGSSEIGLAVAQQAATQGAMVVIVSSNAERVQKAVDCISGEAQGRRPTSRTKEPLQPSLPNLAVSMIWSSPPAIRCN